MFTLAIIGFVLGCGLILSYEIYAFTHEAEHPHETISEITWRICTTHPIIPLLFGILGGHLFWQSASVYQGLCK